MIQMLKIGPKTEDYLAHLLRKVLGFQEILTELIRYFADVLPLYRQQLSYRVAMADLMPARLL